MEVSSVLASFSAPKTQNKGVDVPRRTADFRPTLWGDYFLSYASKCSDAEIRNEEKELEHLRKQVQEMMLTTPDKSPKKLELIDAIQRLGLAYRFETEIQTSLNSIFHHLKHDSESHNNYDLHTTALCFRLLRQQGHYISCDIFNKFTNEAGDFDPCLVKDVKGILSLYEATYFRVRGEEILEKAFEFASSHLETSLPYLNGCLGTLVKQALHMPIRKTLTRIGAVNYISACQQNTSSHDVDYRLLQYAKLDFNLLQKMHQVELSEITRWWKGLDFVNKLPFIRDRLVECYFWAYGVHFEPQYQLARVLLTKAVVIITAIDDIYDAYGTLDELTVFTDAIMRWNMKALDQLPPYMRVCYKALLDIYDEIEAEMAKAGRSHQAEFAKLEIKKMVEAYLGEAQWLETGYAPTFEEYLKICLANANMPANCMVGLGELATEGVCEWIFDQHSFTTGLAIIARLEDDMAGHKFEQKRGHIPSAVECCMKQFKLTEEEACQELQKQVTTALMDVNKEWLHQSKMVSISVLERAFNFIRVTFVLYNKDGDGFTEGKARLKNILSSLFVHPIII